MPHHHFAGDCHSHGWPVYDLRQEYVFQHRRQVDPIEGLTDPVDILVAMHRPRAYDPLIVYTPIPFRREALYSQLNQAQLNRLVEIALEARRQGQRQLAEGIGVSLATLTTHDLSPLLEPWKEGRPWPAVMFCGTQTVVRDSLIEYLQGAPERKWVNHVLCALAWIGDAVVQHKLALWDRSPPAWRQYLHVAPSDYAQEAGWELSGDCRRELVYPSCLGVHVEESDAPLRAFQPAQEDCPWCGRNLVYLLELDLGDPRFNFLSCAGPRLPVLTCDSCTLFADAVYAKIGSDGGASWHPKNVRPEALANDVADWPTSPWQSASLCLQPRLPMQALVSDGVGASQIGGWPGWVQDGNYPKCPNCGQSMPFLAQFDNGDFPSHEGVYYAFLCCDCRVTATTYQQS